MSVAKIALRKLSRQKRRTFLLGGAIAFGVMAATLVNGFTGGLVVNIEANVSKMVAGHIFMASLSPWISPLGSTRSSRLFFQAIFESCSIVTATLPTETGARNFSPF